MARDIHGTVKAVNGSAVPYANVVVMQGLDSIFVTGVMTSDDGAYHIEAQGDNLILKVTCIGYKDTYVRIGNEMTVQNVTLQEDDVSLNAVVVKSKSPKYKMTSEGIVTTVTGSALSNLGTGSDVLRRIPGVFAGKNGYEVFGKGTPVIYVNNRKILDTAEIENLKSEDIKSVEVLMYPGAKYDATAKSVIKITTKRPVGEGVSMNWLSRYEQSYLQNISTRLSWMYRHKNLDVFSYHFCAFYNDWMKSNLTQNVESDASWFQSDYQDARSRNAYLTNTAGINYLLSDDASIGFRYINTWRMQDKGWTMLQTSVTKDEKTYDDLNSYTVGHEKHDPTHQANIYYSGKIGKTTLDVDVDLYHKQSDSDGLTQENSTNYDSRQVDVDGKSISNMFASKITWGFQALGAHINLGAEYTSTHRLDTYHNEQQYVSSSESHIDEKHISPFLEMEWQWPIGALQAGLRYEYAWYDYRDNGVKMAEQSKRFSNVFPTLSFMTGLGKTQLTLSYTTKTRRPSYSELSSNIFYGNRFEYQGGNPYLTPSIVHNVALSASYGVFQARWDYTYNRDAILYWAEMYEGSKTSTLFTFKNVESLKSMSFFLTASPRVGIWNPTLQAGIIKQWLKMPGDEEEFYFNKPMFTCQLSNIFKFGNGYQGGIDLGYTSKGHSDNIYISRSQFSNDIYASKSMLGERLTFYVGASDIFGPSKSGNEMQFPNLKTTQIQWKSSRSVYVAIRYKFNAANSKYKGCGAGSEEKNRL